MRLVKCLNYYYYNLLAFLLNQIFGIDGLVRFIKKCPRQHVGNALRIGGAFVGQKVNFKEGLTIDNASGDISSTGDFSNLHIGHNCYIGEQVFIDLPARIEIHNNAVISARVMFLSHQDCGDRVMSKWYPRSEKSVIVGEGSWIGSGSIILPGVVLGKCCVVGAGSVVNKSFQDYSVVAGVPATIMRILKSNMD